MKQKQMIVCGLVVLIASGASFFAGTVYQKRQRPAFAASQFAQRNNRPNGGMMGNQGFRPAAGEVSSMDDKSITIKLMDNSSKIIILSDKTIFNKTTEGNKADIKTGDKISVFGTTNSDGSITANTISIGNMPIPTR